MENGRIKKAAAKEKVAGKNAVNLFGMRLLFLFSFFIFCCFSFTPGRAQETPVAAYTSADTIRVDSIADRILGVLEDQKGALTIYKSFPCVYSNDSGSVSIFSLDKKIIMVLVDKCGDDHGSIELKASFIDGQLVRITTTDYSWAFEDPAPGDSSCCPTYDAENSDVVYFQNGKIILETYDYEKVHHSSGETESNTGSTYYFDDSGDAAELKEINRWIDFAHSKKSYSAFFGKEK